MTTFHRLLIGTALLAGFAVGCTARNPLDAVVEPPTPINGSIAVTTYNGPVAAGGVTITVTSFDGTSQTTVTAGTVKVGIIVGQVIVPEPKAGNYTVSIFGQPASSPASVVVTLSPANPNANVPLQISGGYLSITAAATGVTMYAETGGYLSFNVHYVNQSAYQQDIIAVPNFSGLPQGWAFVTQQAALKANQTTTFVVQAPILAGTVPTTLTFNGLIGSSLVYTAQVVAQPNYSLTLTRNYTSVVRAEKNCYGVNAGVSYTILNFVVNGTNLTNAYPLAVYLDGVLQTGATLTTTNGSNYNTAIWFGTLNGCNSGNKTPYFQVYYGSQVLWSGTDPLGAYPYSYTN